MFNSVTQPLILPVGCQRGRPFFFLPPVLFLRVIACLVVAVLTLTRGQTTTTFSYSGSYQTYTVPAGVSIISINAYGAVGGTTSCYSCASSTAFGGFISAVFYVTPLQVLYVYAGGVGSSTYPGGALPNPGGFNGGGTGFACGGGGGGGSDVRTSNSLSSRIICAGGGGGGGAILSNCVDIGGKGGALMGAAGVAATPDTRHPPTRQSTSRA